MIALLHVSPRHAVGPMRTRYRRGLASGTLALAALAVGCGSERGAWKEGSSDLTGSVTSLAQGPVAWSHDPPGGLKPNQVPQLVSVTFDDNFGLANTAGNPTWGGGINYINDFWGKHKNPAGSGNAATFDGAGIKATFYYTTSNISAGDDPDHLNRDARTKAFMLGHEAADHTINHNNGGTVASGSIAGKNYSVAQWQKEIQGCKDTLIGAGGIGAKASDVIGFRTPFLGYNDNTFTELVNEKFIYDSTLPNCFDDGENGTNCSWPHTLDNGSHDADVLKAKFSTAPVTSHPGLWEAPAATLVIPPDNLASKYGFTAGLKGRVDQKYPMPYPSLYDKATGRIAGLDWTLLMDAKVSPDEMAAILKYNLDLHLSGNRSPFVFIGHSFMYSFENDKENTPSIAVRDARWKALTDFVTYALTKPEVRIVAVKDIVAWMQNPVGLSGTAPSDDGGVVPTDDGGSGGSSAGNDAGGGTGGVGTAGAAGTGGQTGTGGSAGGGGGAAGENGAGGSGTAGGGAGGAGGAGKSGDAGSDSGCSCRLGGTRPFGASSALVMLAAAALLVRRPRRVGRSSHWSSGVHHVRSSQ
jgi:peptidoglycan/xylan/chitin deacetylase (PgdA/CDA1 family)